MDSFMNTCWNFFWNEGDTIDYVNQLQQPVADQSPTNLELLFLYFSIICIFQDQMYIHFVWQPCLVVDGCWCCIENLWPTKTARRSSTTMAFADHRKPPGKRVVVGGRREVVDVILWQPVTDHRQTFADLRQPPATTPKIVVVRGRRLVVAIVWPSLYSLYSCIRTSMETTWKRVDLLFSLCNIRLSTFICRYICDMKISSSSSSSVYWFHPNIKDYNQIIIPIF